MPGWKYDKINYIWTHENYYIFWRCDTIFFSLKKRSSFFHSTSNKITIYFSENLKCDFNLCKGKWISSILSGTFQKIYSELTRTLQNFRDVKKTFATSASLLFRSLAHPHTREGWKKPNCWEMESLLKWVQFVLSHVHRVRLCVWVPCLCLYVCVCNKYTPFSDSSLPILNPYGSMVWDLRNRKEH